MPMAAISMAMAANKAVRRDTYFTSVSDSLTVLRMDRTSVMGWSRSSWRSAARTAPATGVGSGDQVRMAKNRNACGCWLSGVNISGSGWALSRHALTSPLTPTMVIQGAGELGSLLHLMRLPMGSSLGKNVRAMRWLTMATRWLAAASRVLKARPRTSGMPSVWKYPAVAARQWLIFSWPEGGAGRPSTMKLVV